MKIQKSWQFVKAKYASWHGAIPEACRLPPLQRLNTLMAHCYQLDTSQKDLVKKVRIYHDTKRVHAIHFVEPNAWFDLKPLWDILDQVASKSKTALVFLRKIRQGVPNTPPATRILRRIFGQLKKATSTLHGSFLQDFNLHALMGEFPLALRTKSNTRLKLIYSIAVHMEHFWLRWFPPLRADSPKK
jgi:hypothetical protein